MPSFRKDCPKTCNVCKYSIDAQEYLIFGFFESYRFTTKYQHQASFSPEG